jgi:ATPase subunit of ABC transporter with duplicated ATPase domains
MNLLSFGEEAEEDEREAKKSRTSIPSSHDVNLSSSVSHKQEIMKKLKREIAEANHTQSAPTLKSGTTDEQYTTALRDKIAGMERRRQENAKEADEEESAEQKEARAHAQEAVRARERKRAEKAERKRRKKELKRAAKQRHGRASKLRLRRVQVPSAPSSTTSHTGVYKVDERM